MPHSKLVRFAAVNSVEIAPGVFQCQMNDRVMSNARGVLLKTVVFANNVYNINAGVNDTATFSIDGGGPMSVVLPPGYYSATQLAAALEALIQPVLTGVAPLATISISLNPITAKLQSTVVGATWQWLVASINASIGLDPLAPSAILPSTTLFPFPYFANLYGLQHVTISVKSQDPKTFLNATTQQALFTNSIGVVPVTVPFGGLVIFEQKFAQGALVDFRAFQDLTQLQVSIRDVNGAGIANQQAHLLVEFIVFSDDRLNA